MQCATMVAEKKSCSNKKLERDDVRRKIIPLEPPRSTLQIDVLLPVDTPMNQIPSIKEKKTQHQSRYQPARKKPEVLDTCEMLHRAHVLMRRSAAFNLVLIAIV